MIRILIFPCDDFFSYVKPHRPIELHLREGMKNRSNEFKWRLEWIHPQQNETEFNWIKRFYNIVAWMKPSTNKKQFQENFSYLQMISDSKSISLD